MRAMSIKRGETRPKEGSPSSSGEKACTLSYRLSSSTNMGKKACITTTWTKLVELPRPPLCRPPLRCPPLTPCPLQAHVAALGHKKEAVMPVVAEGENRFLRLEARAAADACSPGSILTLRKLVSTRANAFCSTRSSMCCTASPGYTLGNCNLWQQAALPTTLHMVLMQQVPLG